MVRVLLLPLEERKTNNGIYKQLLRTTVGYRSLINNLKCEFLTQYWVQFNLICAYTMSTLSVTNMDQFRLNSYRYFALIEHITTDYIKY